MARTYAPLAVGISSGLVAAYAFGPAKHHRVVDGNERTAFFALGLFLEINGWRLETTEIDAIESMLALATGMLDEDSLARWIGGRIVRKNENGRRGLIHFHSIDKIVRRSE